MESSANPPHSTGRSDSTDRIRSRLDGKRKNAADGPHTAPEIPVSDGKPQYHRESSTSRQTANRGKANQLNNALAFDSPSFPEPDKSKSRTDVINNGNVASPRANASSMDNGRGGMKAAFIPETPEEQLTGPSSGQPVIVKHHVGSPDGEHVLVENTVVLVTNSTVINVNSDEDVEEAQNNQEMSPYRTDDDDFHHRGTGINSQDGHQTVYKEHSPKGSRDTVNKAIKPNSGRNTLLVLPVPSRNEPRHALPKSGNGSPSSDLVAADQHKPMSGMNALTAPDAEQLPSPNDDVFQDQEVHNEQSPAVQKIFPKKPHPLPSDQSGQSRISQFTNPRTEARPAGEEAAAKPGMITDAFEPSFLEQDTAPHRNFHNYRPQPSAGGTTKQFAEGSAPHPWNAQASARSQTEQLSGAAILQVPVPTGNKDHSNDFNTGRNLLTKTETPDVYQHKRKHGAFSNIPIASGNLSQNNPEQSPNSPGQKNTAEQGVLKNSGKTMHSQSETPLLASQDGMSDTGKYHHNNRPGYGTLPEMFRENRTYAINDLGNAKSEPTVALFNKAEPTLASLLQSENPASADHFRARLEPTRGTQPADQYKHRRPHGSDEDFSASIRSQDLQGSEAGAGIQRTSDYDSDVQPAAAPIIIPTKSYVEQPEHSKFSEDNIKNVATFPYGGMAADRSGDSATIEHKPFNTFVNGPDQPSANSKMLSQELDPPGNQDSDAAKNVVHQISPTGYYHRRPYHRKSDPLADITEKGKAEPPAGGPQNQHAENGASMSIVNNVSPLQKVFSDHPEDTSAIPDGSKVDNQSQAGNENDLYNDMPVMDSYHHRMTADHVNDFGPDGNDDMSSALNRRAGTEDQEAKSGVEHLPFSPKLAVDSNIPGATPDSTNMQMTFLPVYKHKRLHEKEQFLIVPGQEDSAYATDDLDNGNPIPRQPKKHHYKPNINAGDANGVFSSKANAPDSSESVPHATAAPIFPVNAPVRGQNQQENFTEDAFKHRPLQSRDKINQFPDGEPPKNEQSDTGLDQHMWKSEIQPIATGNAWSRPAFKSERNFENYHSDKDSLDTELENNKMHETPETPANVQSARLPAPTSKFDNEQLSDTQPRNPLFASKWRTDQPDEKRDPLDGVDNYRHKPHAALNNKRHHNPEGQFSVLPATYPRDVDQHLPNTQPKKGRMAAVNQPEESSLLQRNAGEERFVSHPSNETGFVSHWLPSHGVHVEHSDSRVDNYQHEPHAEANAMGPSEQADTFPEMPAGYFQQVDGHPADGASSISAQPPTQPDSTGSEIMSRLGHPSRRPKSTGVGEFRHQTPQDFRANSKDAEDNFESSFKDPSHRTSHHPHMLAAAVPLKSASSTEEPENNAPYLNKKPAFSQEEGGRFRPSDSLVHHNTNNTTAINLHESARTIPNAEDFYDNNISENNPKNMAAFFADNVDVREQIDSPRNRVLTFDEDESNELGASGSHYAEPESADEAFSFVSRVGSPGRRRMEGTLEGQNSSDPLQDFHPYRQQFNDEIGLTQRRSSNGASPVHQAPTDNTLSSPYVMDHDPTSHNKAQLPAEDSEEPDDLSATGKNHERKTPAYGFTSRQTEETENPTVDEPGKLSSPRSPDNSLVPPPKALAVKSSNSHLRPVFNDSRARRGSRSRSKQTSYKQHQNTIGDSEKPYEVEIQPEKISLPPTPMRTTMTWKSVLPTMAAISSPFFTDSYVHNPNATMLPDWTGMTTDSSQSSQSSDSSQSSQSSMQCSMSHSSTVGTSMIGYNLMVSFVLFLIGMVIFYFATKGVQKQERKQLLERRMSTGSDWVKTFYSQKIMEDKPPAPTSTRTSSESASDVVTDVDLGLFLPLFWFWKTEEIERRCGKSATQYLRFTEYLIAYASFVVIIATLIVLPLNLSGPLIQAKLEFGRTTIINLDPKSNTLWVHVVFSILLFPVALLFATRFVRTFRGYSKPDRSSRTLMITNLSPRSASEDKIRRHFEEGHPDTEISRINLSYHTNKLHRLDKELQLCTSCLKYYEKTLRPGSEPPIYSRDNLCTRCCCCCCDVGIDAVQYYTNRAAELEIRIEQLIDQPRIPNSTFFVTFEEEEAATKICNQYRHPVIAVRTPKTEFSKDLKTKAWSAQFAPFPDLIKWQNLETGGLHWWLRAIILNVGLFLFLFFITSPIIILNALGVTQWAKNLVILNQVIPGILMVELGFIIGALMKFVTMQTRYHDKIRELMVALKGTFSYTLIAQLLLPTFGLTSAKALYDYLKQSSSSSGQFNWECLFLPDYGMVFVTFLIFQSLFGSSLVFSRILELQMMVFKRCNARSSAEQWLISQRKQPFTFTAGYSRNLVLFAIIVVFAFVVPYVAPVGLFALMMTHIAERYSIFFVNRRAEVPNPIHRSAVNLFLFCVLLQLILMLFFTAIRAGNVGAGAMLIAGVIYTAILIYISWREEFGKFHKVPSTSIGSKFLMHIDEDDDEGSVDPMAESQAYEAPILRRYELLRPLTSKRRSSWRESPPSQPE